MSGTKGAQMVDDLHNPQLLKLQEEFGLSSFAFVVQCANVLAPDLLRLNPSSIIPRYADLEKIEKIENQAERETPGVDNLPTAWLFPAWRPHKVLYFFGTLATQCDILLPLNTATSWRHFAIYFSHNGVWIARNLSRYGTWINGDLLGLPKPGEAAKETALNPESSNHVCAGTFQFFIHPIPHNARASHIDLAMSRLLDLGIPSEGSRTTSATESTSVIFRPSIIQGETYHYLRKTPIAVQGHSQVCHAVRKEDGLSHIAKIYLYGERGRALAQFEMMLRFKDRRNIAFYNDFIRTETDIKIITPTLDAVPLTTFLSRRVVKFTMSK